MGGFRATHKKVEKPDFYVSYFYSFFSLQYNKFHRLPAGGRDKGCPTGRSHLLNRPMPSAPPDPALE